MYIYLSLSSEQTKLLLSMPPQQKFAGAVIELSNRLEASLPLLREIETDGGQTRIVVLQVLRSKQKTSRSRSAQEQ